MLDESSGGEDLDQFVSHLRTRGNERAYFGLFSPEQRESVVDVLELIARELADEVRNRMLERDLGRAIRRWRKLLGKL